MQGKSVSELSKLIGVAHILIKTSACVSNNGEWRVDKTHIWSLPKGIPEMGYSGILLFLPNNL
jgi:hypothetical protein